MEEYKEEVEEKVHLDGGEEVSIVNFVYPRETVSVSSLGYFPSVGSSYKPYNPSLSLSRSTPHSRVFKEEGTRSR